MRATLRLAVAGWCLTVVSGALVLSREPTRQASNADIGTATLTGRVIRGESSNRTPVGRVVVNISLGDGSGNRQAVTDDQGRFGFDRLPAAGFLVTASRPGWVTTYYGSPRPGRPPGVRVAVADGAKVDIEIPIVPGAVIAGRIISEDGQPRPREFPLLLEKRLVGNQQMLSRMRLPYGIGYFERSTNDLGEFRLFGLPPGTLLPPCESQRHGGCAPDDRGRSPVGAAAARFAGAPYRHRAPWLDMRRSTIPGRAIHLRVSPSLSVLAKSVRALFSVWVSFRWLASRVSSDAATVRLPRAPGSPSMSACRK